MNIHFTDGDAVHTLRPLTSTKSVADLRIGILTIREKWELLSKKMEANNDITILSAIIPSLKNYRKIIETSVENLDDGVCILKYPYQLYQWNAQAIKDDFELITEGRTSFAIDKSNSVICPENVFIEEGAKISYSIINASDGPVYIGKNALIMEGNLIKGPFSIGENSVLKMGSKVYGGTTIGPHCVAAGEIKNSILSAYSNKAHEGYLGDSVIGEWCNLGAGTSNSNVKNNAGVVWYKIEDEIFSPGIKGGLIMGDYSRCAINTSFNTGTIAGVCCNIFSNGFPPKFIKDFTWGDKTYIFEKAILDIENWKKLKNCIINPQEIKKLELLYKSQQHHA